MKASLTMWSQSQLQAFRELSNIGETFFYANWPPLALRPRFDSLIIGPSGIGKSHLVRAVAAHLEVPSLRVSHGEWIVLGARSHLQPTMQKIRAFMLEHERGIIHVDELDKARSGFHSEWTIAVFAEIFSMLDRMSPAGARTESWGETECHRLKNDFWFVGSGTWQSIWEESRVSRIGFTTDKPVWDPQALARRIRSAGFIPAELLSRFSDQFIFLGPATANDYRRAAKAFGLTKLARALRVSLDFAQVAEEGLGARWLEKIHADLLKKAWLRGRRDLLPARICQEIKAPDGADGGGIQL